MANYWPIILIGFLATLIVQLIDFKNINCKCNFAHCIYNLYKWPITGQLL
jgi:hypothetical protein